MKNKILISSVTLSLLLSGCSIFSSKEPKEEQESVKNRTVLSNKSKESDNSWNSVGENLVINGKAPYSVKFKSNIFNRNMSNVGVSSIKWDFGDGTYSNEESPIKTFTTAGVYDVYLYANTADGESTYDHILVNVEPNPKDETYALIGTVEQDDKKIKAFVDDSKDVESTEQAHNPNIQQTFNIVQLASTTQQEQKTDEMQRVSGDLSQDMLETQSLEKVENGENITDYLNYLKTTMIGERKFYHAKNTHLYNSPMVVSFENIETGEYKLKLVLNNKHEKVPVLREIYLSSDNSEYKLPISKLNTKTLRLNGKNIDHTELYISSDDYEMIQKFYDGRFRKIIFVGEYGFKNIEYLTIHDELALSKMVKIYNKFFN